MPIPQSIATNLYMCSLSSQSPLVFPLLSQSPVPLDHEILDFSYVSYSLNFNDCGNKLHNFALF